MVQRVSTVAFEGIEARAVDVQVQVAPGLPAFAIVGLPDKAVSEARERVRSALIASGLAIAKLGRIAPRDRETVSADTLCLKFEFRDIRAHEHATPSVVIIRQKREARLRAKLRGDSVFPSKRHWPEKPRRTGSPHARG